MLIGITTAPRRQWYLTSMLRPLAAQKCHIVIAPTHAADAELVQESLMSTGVSAEVLCPAADTHPDGIARGRGLEVNTDRLIEHMLNLGSPRFMTFQDDVEFCRGAVERMAFVSKNTEIIPRFGFCSFYSPHDDCARSPYALWEYRPGRFYGDVAMLWSADMARAFVAENNQDEGHDVEIDHFMRRHPQPQWLYFGHSPCLVQHVGVESATGKDWIYNGSPRQTPNYRREHHAVQEGKPL
jgi:hypothetical protein